MVFPHPLTRTRKNLRYKTETMPLADNSSGIGIGAVLTVCAFSNLANNLKGFTKPLLKPNEQLLEL